MKIIKLVKTTKLLSVPLLALLTFGCGFDSDSSTDSGTTEPIEPIEPIVPEVEGLFASITDTSDTTAGGLKYKLSSADMSDLDLATGAISVDVLYPTDQDQDFSIGLYDTSNDTDLMVVDVILKSGGRMQTRQGGDGGDIAPTHTPGALTNYTITWEAGEYSLYMNNILQITEDYNNTAATAVSYFGVKLGSNTKVAAAASTIDNIAIYSDVAMTTPVFEDDFESYTVGEILDAQGGIYFSGTEAVVAGDDDDSGTIEPAPETTVTDDFESYTIGDSIDAANSAYVFNGDAIAVIAEDPADSTSKSLYLEDDSTTGKPVVSRAFTGVADSGSVSVSVYIPSDSLKSTYIYLGSSEGASSGNRFTEILFGSSEIKFRNADGSQVILADYDQESWVEVTIAWVETAITVTIDGTVYTIDSDGENMFAENADDEGPSLVAFYVGDTSNIDTYSYFDNLDSTLFEAAE